MQLGAIEDLKRCAFCDKAPEDVDDEHRDKCLDESCTDAIHRRVADLAGSKLIRVETRGKKLGEIKIDIPLKRARANLEREIRWRIWHRYAKKPNSALWALSAVVKGTGATLADCNGEYLPPGTIIEVRAGKESKDEDDEALADDEMCLNATPDADVLGANDDYESRNNRVGYLISEFIDNSLMALVRKYEHQGWPRDTAPVIRLFMLVSEDGQDVAVCIEDDANGITLPDLQRMVKLRAKVAQPSSLPLSPACLRSSLCPCGPDIDSQCPCARAAFTDCRALACGRAAGSA